MKNVFILFFVAIFSSSLISAQKSDNNFKKGDVFIISKVENNNYKHIYFPKKNFIIKKGGIVNFENVYEQNIEIVSTKTDKKGNLIATIKLVSGKRFFNSHKYLKANISRALLEKELKRK